MWIIWLNWRYCCSKITSSKNGYWRGWHRADRMRLPNSFIRSSSSQCLLWKMQRNEICLLTRNCRSSWLREMACSIKNFRIKCAGIRKSSSSNHRTYQYPVFRSYLPMKRKCSIFPSHCPNYQCRIKENPPQRQ